MKYNTRIPTGKKSIKQKIGSLTRSRKLIKSKEDQPKKKKKRHESQKQKRKQVYLLQALPIKPTKPTSPTNIPEIFKAIKESYELFYAKRLFTFYKDLIYCFERHRERA